MERQRPGVRPPGRHWHGHFGAGARGASRTRGGAGDASVRILGESSLFGLRSASGAKAGRQQRGLPAERDPRNRVDADPAALDLGSRVPGLQFASTAPRLVKANFLASCCFMPHDQSLVLAGEELCEWQVAGAKLREIHLRDAAKALAVSPCGGYLALGSALALTVYRLGAQGEEVVVSRKVTSNIVSLAFSANHMLAVGTIEHKVLVFHITDDKEADVLEHEQANSLCFSPRGDVLAVVGGDDISGTVSLWQVDRVNLLFSALWLPEALRGARPSPPQGRSWLSDVMMPGWCCCCQTTASSAGQSCGPRFAAGRWPGAAPFWPLPGSGRRRCSMCPAARSSFSSLGSRTEDLQHLAEQQRVLDGLLPPQRRCPLRAGRLRGHHEPVHSGATGCGPVQVAGNHGFFEFWTATS
ncbi:unnamed protein product [Effrenium voratum]|nr:unnamed protein product [Effrenium voratum]